MIHFISNISFPLPLKVPSTISIYREQFTSTPRVFICLLATVGNCDVGNVTYTPEGLDPMNTFSSSSTKSLHSHDDGKL